MALRLPGLIVVDEVDHVVRHETPPPGLVRDLVEDVIEIVHRVDDLPDERILNCRHAGMAIE
jgi:hypothetical protein